MEDTAEKPIETPIMGVNSCLPVSSVSVRTALKNVVFAYEALAWPEANDIAVMTGKDVFIIPLKTLTVDRHCSVSGLMTAMHEAHKQMPETNPSALPTVLPSLDSDESREERRTVTVRVKTIGAVSERATDKA